MANAGTTQSVTNPPDETLPARSKRGNAADETRTAKELSDKAAHEAKAAAEAKAKADELATKAREKADAAKAREEDLKRLEAARKHLRKASPDDPIPLRRIETANPVGDTLYGSPRAVIDLRNKQEFPDVTLLYDGQVVHVISGKDPGRSFWIGQSNIAAMYPRFDI